MLKRPQPFLMEVGDCLVYPTSGKDCINSYYPSKEKIPGWNTTVGHDGRRRLWLIMESSVEEFESALEPIIAAVGRDAIARCWMVKVAANRPPWTPSGIELCTGYQISVFSAGAPGSPTSRTSGSVPILRSGCGSARGARFSAPRPLLHLHHRALWAGSKCG